MFRVMLVGAALAIAGVTASEGSAWASRPALPDLRLADARGSIGSSERGELACTSSVATGQVSSRCVTAVVE
jgi:hypothetical protein